MKKERIIFGEQEAIVHNIIAMVYWGYCVYDNPIFMVNEQTATARLKSAIKGQGVLESLSLINGTPLQRPLFKA